jgi:hypothetical protein
MSKKEPEGKPRWILDPAKDVLPVEEVCSTMRRLISSGHYNVSQVTPAALCGTCGLVKELRFGHCHACALGAEP